MRTLFYEQKTKTRFFFFDLAFWTNLRSHSPANELLFIANILNFHCALNVGYVFFFFLMEHGIDIDI